MLTQNQILAALTSLGGFFKEFLEEKTPKNNWHEKLDRAIRQAQHENGWFTKENVLFSLREWSQVLTKDALEKWLLPYSNKQITAPKTIAVVMAGNIPLVGFHDFIAVLVSGHRVLAKLSSNDKILLPFITEYLKSVAPNLNDKISFTEGKLEGFDAVIATGSNNTSRYFEYYFGGYPNIIRKNRNSIAILTGNETEGELQGLGEDIFRYFGLGCRSVSKLYVPKGYDFTTFFETIFPWKELLQIHKYCNNYDYNKAVYLMSDFKLWDNGFLLLKNDESLASPIGTLYYEEYEDLETLRSQLEQKTEEIQCVVAKGFIDGEVAFGTTQKPQLHDYADGVDTLEFLLQL